MRRGTCALGCGVAGPSGVSEDATVSKRVRTGATLAAMTAKEQVLKEAPEWSEALATAVLRVVKAQAKLEAWFEAESQLSEKQVAEREMRRAEANARELIREEPW
jgi:hypothetical protein